MAGGTAALLLAALIGLSLGALGGGGAILTVPILVYVAGVTPKSAIGMSMVIVGGTSVFGSYIHWRNNNFLVKPAFLFGITGGLGAYLGSNVTHLFSTTILMLVYSGLLLVVGVLMFIDRRPARLSEVHYSAYRCILSGFGVGLVSGCLGIGGGFLIVPALVWFAGLDTKQAMGTSLGIIAANLAAGLAGQLRFASWDWPLTLKLLVCSLIGMTLGVTLARHAPARGLRKAFAAVVFGVAIAIGWQVLQHRS